jgi:hypothetical protein
VDEFEALRANPLPAPDKVTVCGLPGALSEIASVAAWFPVEVGEKTTLMVQLAFEATELPQLLVDVNCEAPLPVTVTLVMERAALPELVRVTVLAALGLFSA